MLYFRSVYDTCHSSLPSAELHPSTSAWIISFLSSSDSSCHLVVFSSAEPLCKWNHINTKAAASLTFLCFLCSHQVHILYFSVHQIMFLLTFRSIIIFWGTCGKAAAIHSVQLHAGLRVWLTYPVLAAVLFVHYMSSLIGFHYLSCIENRVCTSLLRMLVCRCCWLYSNCPGWFAGGVKGWGGNSADIQLQPLSTSSHVMAVQHSHCYPVVIFKYD